MAVSLLRTFTVVLNLRTVLLSLCYILPLSCLFLPKCRKGFFKFWWDEELNLLKEASAESHRIWKAADKPRQGPFFRVDRHVVYSIVNG